ncbi:lisH domain-containing protein C1711.05-like [Lathyrus oleraceus]|uniref:lisH domain-containing protein C1711.05-like n=1 Tax=Pisum sativum TaxID=3888 RepID=UPI0021CF3D91|nr:lisH domain-containing protein C1711.05-like [Pisum sativum]
MAYESDDDELMQLTFFDSEYESESEDDSESEVKFDSEYESESEDELESEESQGDSEDEEDSEGESDNEDEFDSDPYSDGDSDSGGDPNSANISDSEGGHASEGGTYGIPTSDIVPAFEGDSEQVHRLQRIRQIPRRFANFNMLQDIELDYEGEAVQCVMLEDFKLVSIEEALKKKV